jgi:hypothetical protein
MRLWLAPLSLAALAGAASATNDNNSSLPAADSAFASRVLEFAVAGRKTPEVLEDLRASGFVCFEHEGRVVSSSERTVNFQKHVCGGPVPALHGCARNVELGSFDGTLTHIRVSLEHPDGTPNEGIACAR